MVKKIRYKMKILLLLMCMFLTGETSPVQLPLHSPLRESNETHRPSPVYACYGKNDRGICYSDNNPTYYYTVFVDYTDMSLKVYAMSATSPSYMCEIYGWLTINEITLKCVLNKEEDNRMPDIMYCSASRGMAICVE